MALRIRIAGDRFELLVPEGPVLATLEAAFRRFLDEGAPRTRIEVDLGRGARPPGPSALTLPEPRACPDGRLVLEGVDFSAEVSADRSRAEVRGFDECYPVESLVKVLLAERLLSQGGLLVHGVAVAHGDRAALFTGPSGAGKSTLGAWARRGGLALLSDELVAVRPEGAGYRCEGTPWNVGSPGSARLLRVGTLAWADGARVEPAGAAELLRLLLPNAVMPDASAAGRARMFQAASALLQTVPAIRLHFARDVGVAAALSRLLEEG